MTGTLLSLMGRMIHSRAPVGALFALSLLIFSNSDVSWADAAADNKLALLNAQIAGNPHNQQLVIQRARVYLDSSQSNMALEDIDKAKTLGDPINVAYVYGILLYRQGDYQHSREQFDLYLEAHSGHRSSLDYRARLLRDSGEYQAALADYQQLLAMSDDLAPGYYVSVAGILVALPEYGVDEALAFLDARMEVVGYLSSLQRYAIALETDRGNYESAIERLSTLDPKLRATPEWQVEMAELLLLDGRPEDALIYISLAREQIAVLKMTGSRRQLLDELENLKRNAEQAAVQPSR